MHHGRLNITAIGEMAATGQYALLSTNFIKFRLSQFFLDNILTKKFYQIRGKNTIQFGMLFAVMYNYLISFDS